MAEQPPEKVLELIRRLLALSTSSNEHEAAQAASKAQELLLKYNLEMSQIKQEKGEEVERWDFHTPLHESWLDSLMGAVSTANLCRVVRGKHWVEGNRNGNVFTPGKMNRKYYLFGKRVNLEVTEFMYAYLAGEIDRLTPSKKGVRYKTSFRLGAVVTISQRLREELQHFQSTPETKALIVVSDKAVGEAVKRDFPKLYAGKRVSISDNGAYRDGVAAGKTVQFRQGVSDRNAVGQGLLK